LIAEASPDHAFTARWTKYMSTCSCIQNEEGLTVVFCRPCAMSLDQGGEDWFRARMGALTASRVSDALAKNRQGTGPGITRLNYQAELVCERLNGFAYEGGFQSIWMDRGKEEEDGAALAYELMVGVEAQRIGFVQHPSISRFGASPDRTIGKAGLLEVKNRKTNIHFELLRSLKVPTGDVDQVLTEMACADWVEWADYVSYDRRAPAGCDLFVRRFYRDDHKARIAEIEERGQEFLFEVEKLAKELQERAEAGFIFLEREAQLNGNDLTAQLTGSLAMLEPNAVVVPIKRKKR
jgi:hypothetical protein